MRPRHYVMVVVLFAGFALAGGLLRPAEPTTGLAPDAYWAEKTHWHQNADVVLAGCSRVYRGLSPGAMNQALPGCRIRNFAFSLAAYTPEYLQAIDQVLDTRSRHRAIVLGIARHNFGISSAEKNGFLECAHTPRMNRWFLRHFGAVSYFTRPYDVQEYLSSPGRQRSQYHEVYHPDGWVASYRVPEDPTRFLRDLPDQAVRQDLVDGLLAAVARWRQQGIAVYALRVPTTPATRAVEDRAGGLDVNAFAARFRKAGGVWLSFPVEEYHSYDGSHLVPEAAMRLSRQVAEAIRDDEQQR